LNSTVPTVFVVDDASDVREALTRLLSAAGYQVRAFESAERFLDEFDAQAPGCLILDVYLPGLSGRDLQRALAATPSACPIIFMSGASDIQTCVDAMKEGAIDFLTKPIDKERLFATVSHSLRQDEKQREEQAARSTIQQRLETLTRRERQVMLHVTRGRLNKHIGFDLGIGEKTVKVHRARVMSKMKVRSVVELVYLGTRVGVAMQPALLASDRSGADIGHLDRTNGFEIKMGDQKWIHQSR
jgi:FixJ family two-component response regulator